MSQNGGTMYRVPVVRIIVTWKEMKVSLKNTYLIRNLLCLYTQFLRKKACVYG